MGLAPKPASPPPPPPPASGWRGRSEWVQTEPLTGSPAPATLGEVWDASRTLQSGDNSNAQDLRLRRAWGPTLAAINDVRRREGKRPLLNPADGIRVLPMPDRSTGNAYGYAAQANVGKDAATADVEAEARRIQQQYPGALPGFVSGERLVAGEVDREKGDRVKARGVLDRSDGFTAGAVSLAGTMTKAMEDPQNIWLTAVGGGGGTLVRVMASEFLINALGEAVMQPQVADNRRILGEELTAAEALTNVVTAGAGSAGLAGLTHVAAPFIGRLMGGAADGAAFTREAVLAKVYDVLPQPMRERWASAAEIPDTALPEIAAEVLGGDRLTPQLRDAATVIDRGRAIEGMSPFRAGARNDAYHEAKLDVAMAALREDRPRFSARAELNSSTAAPRGTSENVSRGTSGVDSYMAAVRRHESSGSDVAQAETSSAYGRYQFTKGTWKAYYLRRYGRQGLSDAQIYAKRADGGLQDRLMLDLTQDNLRTLQRGGHDASGANLYLLHFAGPRDGMRVLDANPNTPVRELMSPAALEANPHIRDMTAGQMREWAARSVGEAAAPVARAAPAEDGQMAALERDGAALDAEHAALRARDAAGGSEVGAVEAGAVDAGRVEMPMDTAPVRFEPAEPDPAAVQEIAPPIILDPDSPAPLTEAVIAAGGIDIESGFSGTRAAREAARDREALVAQIMGMVRQDRAIAERGAAGDAAPLPHGLLDPKRGATVDALAERAAEAGVITGTTPAARRAAFIETLARELGGPMDSGRPARIAQAVQAVEQRAFKRWDADDPIWESINRADAEEAMARTTGDISAPIDADIDPALMRGFDDPAGPEAMEQIASLEHDVRMMAAEQPEAVVWLDTSGPRRVSDVLQELDEERAAIDALKRCMLPEAA